MAGLAVLRPHMNSLYADLAGHAAAEGVEAELFSPAAASHFAERFRQDSAKAGAARALLEKRRQAERLHAAQDFEAALDAFHAAAEAAQELGEPGEEAAAVLGMADCLSQEREVDEVLVLGMFDHAASRAAEAGNNDVRFHALAGAASLRRSCGRRSDSAQAWSSVLEFARSLANPKYVSLACTQLAFVLLDSAGGAGVEMVNEARETVHQVAGEGSASSSEEPLVMMVGPNRDLRTAVKLLEEAKEAVSSGSGDPSQAALARMNLAGALCKAGNTANKRRAEQELVDAFAQVRERGSDQLRLQLARQLVELREENPWLGDGSGAGHEAALSECAALVQASDSKAVTQQRAMEIAQASDPEARHLQARAAWAQRKLVEMAQPDSDSEDDVSGPAHPKGEGWRRD